MPSSASEPEPESEPALVADQAPALEAKGATLSSVSPDGSREVSLRWQGAVGWLVTTGFCLYLGIGSLVAAAVTAYLGQFDVAVITLIIGLLLSLTFRPLLRMAPKYSARQGVALNDRGFILIRYAKGTMAEARTDIPWSQVARVSRRVKHVRTGNSRRTEYYVDIRLSERPSRVRLPHWAALSRNDLQLNLNFSGYHAVAKAFRAVRPDLFHGS